MERTIKLRGLQIKDTLILSTKFTLIFMAITLIFGLLLIFGVSNANNVDFAWQQFQLWDVISPFLNFYITIFVGMLIFSDGWSHFDTSLRFGISRKSYFSINLIIYTLIAAIPTLLNRPEFIAVSGGGNAQSPIVVSFLAEFNRILIFALLTYGFYKFKFKFLFMLLGGFIFISVFFGFIAANFGEFIISQILTNINPTIFSLIGAVILGGIYYYCVTHIDIQN